MLLLRIKQLTMAKVLISSEKCLLRSLVQIPRGKYCYSTDSEDKSPLSGIRVMDLTRVVAGPYCTMLLGDLGAEILKIEEPGTGDQTRQWGPFFGNSKKATGYFVSLNRNKKSVCIDLKRGRDIIYDLARKSDVLMENYVPGKLSQYGLSFEEIHKVAPHLIYCSLTGYGYKGPYRNRPGYDVIAASCGGLLDMTGPEDGPPCRPGVALTDISTGLYAHGAIMAALIQRSRTKRGQWIQCDLLSTQFANLINVGSTYLNANQEAKKWGSAMDSIVPYEAFKTKDGWFTVGTGSDAQFRDLLERINLEQLNGKYETNAIRVKKREELLKILKSVFIQKTNDEWSEIFEGSSFPCSPVNNMKNEVPTVHLRLRKPRSSKKVQWTQGTVDNEDLNKKKSKCCCIYEKPKAFGESSSDDSDDECEHCHGHKDDHKKVLPINKPETPSAEIPHSEPIATGSA